SENNNQYANEQFFKDAFAWDVQQNRDERHDHKASDDHYFERKITFCSRNAAATCRFQRANAFAEGADDGRDRLNKRNESASGDRACTDLADVGEVNRKGGISKSL